MSILWDDLQYALRLIRRDLGFASIAVLALALGIGVNTALFSVVNGVLLRPLPYPDPDRLVVLYESTPAFDRVPFAYPNFVDWRRENTSFTEMALFRTNDFNLTGLDQPERVVGDYTSAGLFEILGVAPFLGRNFLPEEDQPGADGVVVLGFRLWNSRFGADPAILGRSISLNGRAYTVIGVMPENFRFNNEADLYLPLGQWPQLGIDNRSSHAGLWGVGRLKPGVSLETAKANLDAIANRLAQAYPDTNRDNGATVISMHGDLVRNIRPTLLMLSGAVAFVLIIACANVANLLLARSNVRQREFAVRAALGAERGRIMRQLLTESAVLGGVAGVVGLLLAIGGTRLALAAIANEMPRAQDIGVSGYVLVFTLAISVMTGFLFGLFPALRTSGASAQEALREGARAVGSRHRRHAQGAFVVLQIGLAVVLLTGAGLMIQSIWRLWQVDLGANTSNVLTSQIALSPTALGSPSDIRAAFGGTLARVQGIPGVESAAITSILPLSDELNEMNVWLGGGSAPPREQMSSILFMVTTADYLSVMGMPLKSGRFFTEQDTPSSTPVAAIDEVMARRLFADQDPLGQQLSINGLGAVSIVGVVGHLKHMEIGSDAQPRNQLYFPFGQVPDRFIPIFSAGANVLMRTVSDPLSIVPAVRREVAGPMADQPVYGIQTMEQVIERLLSERRFAMNLLLAFASAALLLASLGIYGVMSYSVGQRTREFGIRVALGTTRGRVLWLVVREGLALALVGLLAGLLASLGLTRLLENSIYGVQPNDPVTLVTVALAMICVALFASYLPAHRATRVDPMVALRSD